MTVQADDFPFKLYIGFNADNNTVEVHLPGQGFSFSNENEDFPATLYDYLENDLTWSDALIASFKNFVFSNDWPEKCTMNSLGVIQPA